MKRSKRYREALKLVDKTKQYEIPEAISILKKTTSNKFDETVELAFHLLMSEKEGMIVRGVASLPYGTGKKVRVLVLTINSEQVQEARDAGADFVGFEELLEKIKNGWSDFDVVITTPDSMKEVSKVGRHLGPKGLMPTPKTGTVTTEVGKRVREVKKGQVQFKIDKGGNIHLPVGKISFKEEELIKNINTAITSVNSSIVGGKGQHIKSLSLSSAMAPSLRLKLK